MKKSLNKKLILKIFVLIFIIAVLITTILVIEKRKKIKGDDEEYKSTSNNETHMENTDEKITEKVDIIDVNSKTRPYAIVVNNTPIAVKVQQGLNDAYMVYEIPTEGNTSRLLALYKDVNEDLVIGTIRSARHNFIDFALESDAIFGCFGWSHYAEKDLKSGSIDYFQGLYGKPFYRNNPEKLPSEHTAYTDIESLNKQVKAKGIRETSEKSILLNYHVSDVDLSGVQEAKEANTIKIPYGAAPQISSFKYNEETKMYTRYENTTKCIDYKTKEEVTTKNIIVQKINYKMCDDNYYWDLDTIGSGEGYYITNGYAVPIKWSKSNRKSKTKYMYKEGTILDGQNVSGQEISVSDGRTWIEVQTKSYSTTIE